MGKRIIFICYGGWCCEASLGYKKSMETLAGILTEMGNLVEIIVVIPSMKELMKFDAIVFVSPSFEDFAPEIKIGSGTNVFFCIEESKRWVDNSGVVFIDPSIGWDNVAKKIMFQI